MSTTIANQLIDLNINLNEIYNQTAEQTKLIGDLYDTIESLSTPITQPTPVLLVNGETGEVTSTLTQTQSGYVAAGTKIASLNLKDLANTGLIPSNIVAGATIFGVEGTASSGVDTSDATANAEHILKDKTAWVNGNKITGTMANNSRAATTMELIAGTDSFTVRASNNQATGYTEGGNRTASKAISLVASTNEPKIVAMDGANILASQTLADDDFTAGNIRSGVKIFNLTGTYTSDATADTTHILKDKIAYSKGSKITGSMANNGTITKTLSSGEVYTIPAGYHSGSGKITAPTTGTVDTSGTATASDLVSGKTAWVNGSKITGTMPTINSIIKQASAEFDDGGDILYTTTATDIGYLDGSTPITLGVEAHAFGNASTAHVLNGMTFTSTAGLKAAGTMTNHGAVTTAIGAGSSYTIPAGYHNGSGKITAASLAAQTSGTAAASHIAEGKTAWVNGSKVTGTMTDHGAVTMALTLGGTYTIPAGYHNGGGKVTTQALSSQTRGTATAADIVKGQTAWVDGSKITGTMPAYDGDWLRPSIDEFDGADLNMTCTIDQGWYVTKDQTLSIAADMNELIEYIGIAEEMSF